MISIKDTRTILLFAFRVAMIELLVLVLLFENDMMVEKARLCIRIHPRQLVLIPCCVLCNAAVYM